APRHANYPSSWCSYQRCREGTLPETRGVCEGFDQTGPASRASSFDSAGRTGVPVRPALSRVRLGEGAVVVDRLPQFGELFPDPRRGSPASGGPRLQRPLDGEDLAHLRGQVRGDGGQVRVAEVGQVDAAFLADPHACPGDLVRLA